MSIYHKQPAFNNVVAGSTASITNLHQGDVCEALLLKLGGTFTKAQIDGIRVRLGGKAVVDDLTGSQLDTINKYMGRTDNAAYLMIHFADPNSRTIDGEAIGGIDTSLNYGSFSIEVDINSGATSPTLECWMLKRPAQAARLDRSVFKAYLKATQNLGAAGTYSLQPPLGSLVGNLINRVHHFHSNITKLNVKKSGLDIQDEGEVGVIQFLQNELNRTTQAGHFCYDPLFDNNQSNSISTTKPDGQPAPLEFRATVSAADNIIMVSELYTSIDRV